MGEETTLCDVCAENFRFLILAWGRNLTDDEKRANQIMIDEGRAEKCTYYDRYFNESFPKRKTRCEGFAN